MFNLISVFSVHEYDDDTYKKYHGVALNEDNANRESFEKALGVSVLDSFELYEAMQSKSLKKAL